MKVSYRWLYMLNAQFPIRTRGIVIPCPPRTKIRRPKVHVPNRIGFQFSLDKGKTWNDGEADMSILEKVHAYAR